MWASSDGVRLAPTSTTVWPREPTFSDVKKMVAELTDEFRAIQDGQALSLSLYYCCYYHYYYCCCYYCHSHYAPDV